MPLHLDLYIIYMKNKILIGLLIVILAIGGVWYFSPRQSKIIEKHEVKKVRIGYLPLSLNLPLYVADKKNYFREAGIDVEMVKFESPNQVGDALLNRQIDMTGPGWALGIAGIVEYKNPGKMKIYAISGDHDKYSGHSLILPVNSTITNFEQLKGKKLGILAGTIQWRTIAREILAKNGLDMDYDVTIVELAPSVQVQALKSGQIDALLALEPVPTIAIGNKIAKLWIKSPANKFIADPFWYGVGVLNAQFSEENPGTMKEAIDILEKATNEVNQNFDTNRIYFKGYTSLTNVLISKVPPIDFKVCNSFSDPDKGSVKKFFDIFSKYKVVVGKIDFDGMLYCK